MTGDGATHSPVAIVLQLAEGHIVHTVGQEENLQTIISGMRHPRGTVLLLVEATMLGDATGGMIVVNAHHIVSMSVPRELVNALNEEASSE